MKLAIQLAQQVFDAVTRSVTEPVSIYSYQVLRDFNIPLGTSQPLLVL
jgi:hypothetical protein